MVRQFRYRDEHEIMEFRIGDTHIIPHVFEWPWSEARTWKTPTPELNPTTT